MLYSGGKKWDKQCIMDSQNQSASTVPKKHKIESDSTPRVPEIHAEEELLKAATAAAAATASAAVAASAATEVAKNRKIDKTNYLFYKIWHIFL